MYGVVFFKYLSCLYHLRSPSRETIGVVSIGRELRKRCQVTLIKLIWLMYSNDGHYT